MQQEDHVQVFEFGEYHTFCGIAGADEPLLAQFAQHLNIEKNMQWSYPLLLQHRHHAQHLLSLFSLQHATSRKHQDMAEFAFEHASYDSYCGMPNIIAALLSMGKRSGVCVDIGYSGTHVQSVYNCRCDAQSYLHIPVGGKQITEHAVQIAPQFNYDAKEVEQVLEVVGVWFKSHALRSGSVLNMSRALERAIRRPLDMPAQFVHAAASMSLEQCLSQVMHAVPLALQSEMHHNVYMLGGYNRAISLQEILGKLAFHAKEVHCLEKGYGAWIGGKQVYR